MPRVMITPPGYRDRPGEHVDILKAAGLEVCFPVTEGKSQLTEVELLANLDGIDATLAGSEPYTPAVIARFPELRVISRVGVGYDQVDLAASTSAGVAVGYAPGTNHDAVAEHAMAMLLGIARRIVPNHEMVVKGGFTRTLVPPLRGQTLGIVGYGRIGRAVVARAKAFQMTCIAFDPVVDRAAAAADGVELVSLDELFARSLFISLHAPHLPSTDRLIRAENILKMRDGVFIVNTARGALVDESDLAAALRSGKVAAVGTDVFAVEPPVGSPLLTAPNVLYSPHVASGDHEAVRQMFVMSAQTIVDLYQGRWPAERIVNGKELGSGWTWKRASK